MDIEGLKDFIALTETKSFSRAASSRHITQPAFSRRIKALEEAVGVDLVDRRAKGFKLTTSGERFLVRARNVVDVLKNAVAEAQSLATRLSDPVYLSAPSYLFKTFFPDWYKTLLEKMPGLTMRSSYHRGTDALEDLRRGTADFALILQSKKVDACYDLEGLKSAVVGKERMVAVRGRHSKSRDLLMYEQGSYLNTLAENVVGRKGGTIAFESTSSGMLKEMALAGFGIAVLPESLVEDEMAQGFLVPAGGALDCDIILVRGEKLSGKRAEKVWAISSQRGSSALRA